MQNLSRLSVRHAMVVVQWGRGFVVPTRANPSHLSENLRQLNFSIFGDLAEWHRNRLTDSTDEMLRFIILFGRGDWSLSWADSIRSAIRLNQGYSVEAPIDTSSFVRRIAMSIPLSVATLEELGRYWDLQAANFAHRYREGLAYSQRLPDLTNLSTRIHFESYYAFSEIYSQLATHLQGLILADRRQRSLPPEAAVMPTQDRRHQQAAPSSVVAADEPSAMPTAAPTRITTVELVSSPEGANATQDNQTSVWGAISRQRGNGGWADAFDRTNIYFGSAK